MKLTKRAKFLAVIVCVVVCAYGQETHYNYDRGANFAGYKTYQWVEVPGSAVPDPLIDRDIQRAVDEQLAQKGLTRVDKGADLYIDYQAVLSLEKSVNLSAMGDRFGGWGGWESGTVQGQTSTVPVGILVVDLYDSGRKQLIWRGDVSKTIDLKKNPDKNYKNLQKAMAKLFKDYPPQPNK